MGLGNPGPEYRDTRHNAGHWCVQRLAEETGAVLENRRLARTGQVDIAGHGTVLALSRTYVNLSGEAAEYSAHTIRGRPERLIVVSDDINLPVGAIRIRKQGSAGGHKGLRSITAAIGTDKYKRVRIGVGKPASPDRQIEHVLGVPGTGERAAVDESIDPRSAGHKDDRGRGRRAIHESIQLHGAGGRRYFGLWAWRSDAGLDSGIVDGYWLIHPNSGPAVFRESGS